MWNISKYNFGISQDRITEMTKQGEREKKEIQHLVSRLNLTWLDLGSNRSQYRKLHVGFTQF